MRLYLNRTVCACVHTYTTGQAFRVEWERGDNGKHYVNLFTRATARGRQGRSRPARRARPCGIRPPSIGFP